MQEITGASLKAGTHGFVGEGTRQKEARAGLIFSINPAL
jgi:hypothetical protein